MEHIVELDLGPIPRFNRRANVDEAAVPDDS